MKRTLFITLFLSIFSFNSTVSADVKVVTSIKPIHSLAAYVMDGVGKPNVIVDGYNSPHGFSLKPSHAKMIENADLIIWVGEDLEAFLEKPLDSIAKKAKKVELMDLKGIKKLKFRNNQMIVSFVATLNLSDIKKAIKTLNNLRQYNFSQGTVVRNKKVVSIEGKGGTKKMLEKSRSKKFRNHGAVSYTHLTLPTICSV